MIGLRLYNLRKCYLLNTKGVASQKRGCPLSNYREDRLFLKRRIEQAIAADRKGQMMDRTAEIVDRTAEVVDRTI